jgi:hypothetical protein
MALISSSRFRSSFPRVVFGVSVAVLFYAGIVPSLENPGVKMAVIKNAVNNSFLNFMSLVFSFTNIMTNSMPGTL